MNKNICRRPENVFKRIGRVEKSEIEDALIIKTKNGVVISLCPNSEDDVGRGIHIDEINVPKRLRRRGAATAAMISLCRLADEYQFEIYGGPIGWGDISWSKKFVEWTCRLGFEKDLDPFLPPVDDPSAFYVRRRSIAHD